MTGLRVSPLAERTIGDPLSSCRRTLAFGLLPPPGPITLTAESTPAIHMECVLWCKFMSSLAVSNNPRSTQFHMMRTSKHFKMIWFNTRCVVTHVVKVVTFWIVTFNNNKCCSISFESFSIKSSVTISMFILVCQPNPTVIRLIDFTPKQFFTMFTNHHILGIVLYLGLGVNNG